MIKQRGELFRIIMFFVVVVIAITFSVSFSNWGDRFSGNNSYDLHSIFEEIGNLRIGSPVKMSGVLVGRVRKITLNSEYQAEVTFMVKNEVKIPEDSSVKIVTQGILGGNYLSLTPGLASQFLRPHSLIAKSYSAFIMENFIDKALSEISSKEK